MNVISADTESVTVTIDQNDLHNLIGAMYNYRSGKINLMGSPFELRLRDLIDDLRDAEKALHDQNARARGLVVEGDVPVEDGAF